MFEDKGGDEGVGGGFDFEGGIGEGGYLGVGAGGGCASGCGGGVFDGEAQEWDEVLRGGWGQWGSSLGAYVGGVECEDRGEGEKGEIGFHKSAPGVVCRGSAGYVWLLWGRGGCECKGLLRLVER